MYMDLVYFSRPIFDMNVQSTSAVKNTCRLIVR